MSKLRSFLGEVRKLGVRDTLQLAAIVVIFLTGETLRLVGCKLMGRNYRHPTERVLDDAITEDSDT